LKTGLERYRSGLCFEPLACSHKYGSIYSISPTVDIPDPFYRELKGKAARAGRSTKELMVRGVEQELRAEPSRRPRRVTLPIVPSKRARALKLDNAEGFEITPFPLT
jgi:hypothetical protein